MSTFTTQSTTSHPQKREELRAELEATRSAFHSLLAEVEEADWKRPTQTTKWTIGEILSHVTSYLEVVLPMALTNARKGKNMPKMPQSIGNYFNLVIARRYAHKLSRQTIAARYDEVHAKALQLLEGVQPDEWEKSTYLPIGRLNVTQLFQHHSGHFQTHLQDIRYGLSHKK